MEGREGVGVSGEQMKVTGKDGLLDWYKEREMKWVNLIMADKTQKSSHFGDEDIENHGLIVESKPLRQCLVHLQTISYQITTHFVKQNHWRVTSRDLPHRSSGSHRQHRPSGTVQRSVGRPDLGTCSHAVVMKATQEGHTKRLTLECQVVTTVWTAWPWTSYTCALTEPRDYWMYVESHTLGMLMITVYLCIL